jgi:hypothetical protein
MIRSDNWNKLFMCCVLMMYPLDTKALKCYMEHRMPLNVPHKKSLSEILKGFYISIDV